MSHPDTPSGDDRELRLVDVDAECVFAILGFPPGACDMKSKLPPADLAATLRMLADSIDRKASTN